jgi:DNA-binding LytR/AlgR family response regulator
MILTVSKEPLLKDDYVDIKYRELTSSISQIIDICNYGCQKVIGEMDGKKYPVDINDIYYFEWVDGHSCICTAENVYTSTQTISQFEQILGDKDFVRSSKPMLVNVNKIKWISGMFNMKMLAELINGEKIAISRHYRNNILDKIYGMANM